jgi:hypothetical protein
MEVWDKDKARISLANNEFIDCEYRAVKNLIKRLPPFQTESDLLSEIRLYALEAIEIFDPTRVGPKSGRTSNFKTFLTKHLMLKSCEFFHRAWRKKRVPEGRYIYLNTDVLEQNHTDNEATDNLEFEDFKSQLSPLSLEMLESIQKSQNFRLCAALTDPESKIRRRKQIIRKITGRSKEEVKFFVSEIKKKAREHISSIKGTSHACTR